MVDPSVPVVEKNKLSDVVGKNKLTEQILPPTSAIPTDVQTSP